METLARWSTAFFGKVFGDLTKKEAKNIKRVGVGFLLFGTAMLVFIGVQLCLGWASGGNDYKSPLTGAIFVIAIGGAFLVFPLVRGIEKRERERQAAWSREQELIQVARKMHQEWQEDRAELIATAFKEAREQLRADASFSEPVVTNLRLVENDRSEEDAG